MIRRCFIASLLAGLAFASFGPARLFAQDKPRTVFLEISAGSRSLVGTQHRWMEMLQDVGADRVISRTSSMARLTVEETETASSIVITVTGAIVGNKLKLPGGNFTINDKAGIRALLKRLRDDGAKVAMAEKKAFGLTSEQLVELHGKLSAPVELSTQGQRAGEIVKQLIGKQPKLNFVMDQAAKAAFASDEKIAEELKGLSTGTALAAILRPLGIVMQPKREQGKSLEIMMIDSRESTENWPIGWPIEEPPVIVEPKLFEKLDIEIRGYAMDVSMNAIQKKTGIPFLYDHNTMAREGIEMDKVKVTLVQKKVSLMVAASKILRQTKPGMSEELRVDENGKSFLWITVR